MFLSEIFTGSAGTRFVLSGLILCVSGLLAEDRVKPKTATAPKAGTAGQQGMTISRDPQSGQLQSGTRDITPPPSSATVGEAPQPVRLPNGLMMIQATADHMSTSIVTRNADGTLKYECVDGKAKAEAMVKKLEEDARKDTKATKEKAGER